MKKITLTALLITLSVAPVVSQAASEGRPADRRGVPPVPPPWTRRPLVQIAVVLDAGRGMSGLIHQAKAEIWPIVNEMLFTTKDGNPPIVQLAILTQGGSENPLGGADTQILTPFTTNYDAIFSRLNMLRTGDKATDDYIRTIRIALRRLQWSPYPEDLKILFVAGDGWFTRIDDELAWVCQEAIDSGIIINTLYCGAYKFGIDKRWPEAAYCGAGQYIGIDYVRRPKYTQTPLDKKILELNEELNETYLLDADRWDELYKQQRDRDREVTLVSKEAAFQRTLTKAAKGFLMDATYAILNEQTGTWGLEPDIPPVDLPPVTTEKEFTQLQEKARARREIEEQILQLAAQRRVYLLARQPQSESARPTLGQAVVQVIREQAQAKGFQLAAPDTFIRRDSEPSQGQ